MPVYEFEKINLQFDIEKLLRQFSSEVKHLEPAYNGKHYHGWSLQSRDGSYTDGWHHGSSVYKNANEIHKQTAKEIGLVADTSFNKDTNLCTGYFSEVLSKLKELGLNPCRTRIVGIPSGQQTNWHRDHREGFYWVRLHIPLLTNDKCTFRTENAEYHMPADGSAYLVNTALMHEAINLGDSPRYHIISQVWDTHGISQKFQYIEKPIKVI